MQRQTTSLCLNREINDQLDYSIMTTLAPGSRVFAVLLSVLVIFWLNLGPAFALEMLMTDEQKNEVSAAILTGCVVSTEFVRELEFGALWRTLFKVETVHKTDRMLFTNTVIYFEQMYSGPIGTNGIGSHGRACPPYPEVRPSQKAKLWCTRGTIGGRTNVLFIPSRQWIKSE